MSSGGRIHRISISKEKGTPKVNVAVGLLKPGHGLVGDAHAGSERPVSLLPHESFAAMEAQVGPLNPGDFAENITTSGLDFTDIAVGDRLKIGATAVLEIMQIGKECHSACHIGARVGDCIMPREGLFASVISGGEIITGDKIVWVPRRVTGSE